MAEEIVSTILKVIMVEDSSIIVSRVENMLSDIPGVNFIGNAGNIPAAMELFRAAAPDVAILDINLGSHDGKNGINLLNIVRQLYPKMTLIMLTNMSDERYRALCKHYGADYFLDKSNEFDKIPEILVALQKRE